MLSTEAEGHILRDLHNFSHHPRAKIINYCFTLVQFFLQFHANVMGSFLSCEGVTIVEGNRRSDVEEVAPHAAPFFDFAFCENRNQNGCV